VGEGQGVGANSVTTVVLSERGGRARTPAIVVYAVAIGVLLVAGVLAGLVERWALPDGARAVLAALCLSGALVLARRTIRIALGALLCTGASVALLTGLPAGDVERALGAWTELAVLLSIVPIVSAVLIRRRYIQVVIAAATRVGALVTQLAVLLSGHVVGSVALLAVVPVLGDFLGLRRQSAAVRRHYAQLILRGFVACVAWSPSTGAMGVIVLATGVRWTELAPVLLVVGLSGLLLGAVWTIAGHRRSAVPVELSDEDFAEAMVVIGDDDRARMLELVGFLTVTFGLILLLEVRDFASTVVVVPTVMLATTLGLLLVTEGPSVVAVTVREHLGTRMPRGAGEASFLLAAGFLGTVLALSGLSEAAVGRTLELAGSAGISLQVMLPLLVVAVTLFGVPPLVSVALISGALPLALTGLGAPLYAALLVIGSGVSLLVAPLTPTMLMVADYAGTSPTRTGVRDNRVFAPVYLVVTVAVANFAAVVIG
jgi:hypothetical protein